MTRGRNHGGKRPGAGKPKGYKHQRSLEKAELRQQFQAQVSAQFGDMIRAQLAAALGVNHLMARDRDGTWTWVTDPAVMAKVLNSGESFYRVYAQNPDPRALKDILDRTLGSPTQAVELSGPEGQPLATESDEALTARALALLKKL